MTFSLIELMITVAIIGVLAAIAVPTYTQYVNRAKTVDLWTTVSIGQEMVTEYIQSTHSSDCTGMQGTPFSMGLISIPISSPNIGISAIELNQGASIPSCGLIAGAMFNNRPVVIFSIPTINNDGSISWINYSNGAAILPSLPLYNGVFPY